MTLTDSIGFIGYGGLTSSLAVCFILIMLTIYQQFHINPLLIRITSVLIDVQTLLLGTAVFVLAVLLEVNAFEFNTVFTSVEINTPPFIRLGGLWSNQSSSLLFWSFLLSAAASICARLTKKIKLTNFESSVLLVLEVTLIFFILPDVIFSNPFQKTWQLSSGAITHAVFAPASDALILVPPDGLGMTPSLRHIAMLLHPPILYLGLVGLFIPYTFAIASLINGEKIDTWIAIVSKPTQIAWVFLTIGMLLGSWWAYSISGWGGYWSWDAVEIAGLLPWLLSFGLLHSIVMVRRRRYQFIKWIYFFSCTSALLILSGILITRSGILESVHAYAKGAMGPALTVLLTIHLASVIGLLIKNRRVLSQKNRKLSTSYSEELVRIFNLCLVYLTLFYLFGQTLPITSQIFLNEMVSFTPQDYGIYSAPILLIMVILTALFPLGNMKDGEPQRFNRLLKWMAVISALCPLALLFFARLTFLAILGFWSGAFLLYSWLYTFIHDFLSPGIRRIIKKNQAASKIGKNPATICIHFGIALMVLGILGVENLSTSYDIYLGNGEFVTIEKYSFSGHFIEEDARIDGISSYGYRVDVRTPRASQYELIPLVEYFPKLDTYQTKPATSTGFLRDVQVVLYKPVENVDEDAHLQVSFFPLISWIWVGCALMVAGMILSLKKGTPFGVVEF
ncbi:MAG: cytochrome c biogenesis protein CcsA [Anaerolineaceae bacterium]|nr:cytochrome c biogenesis protein CcsA [Anaerolineaceae bacterium]